MKKMSLEKMEKIEGGINIDWGRLSCTLSYLVAIDGAGDVEIDIINGLFLASPCAVYF